MPFYTVIEVNAGILSFDAYQYLEACVRNEYFRLFLAGNAIAAYFYNLTLINRCLCLPHGRGSCTIDQFPFSHHYDVNSESEVVELWIDPHFRMHPVPMCSVA